MSFFFSVYGLSLLYEYLKGKVLKHSLGTIIRTCNPLKYLAAFPKDDPLVFEVVPSLAKVSGGSTRSAHECANMCDITLVFLRFADARFACSHRRHCTIFCPARHVVVSHKNKHHYHLPTTLKNICLQI